MNRVYLRHSGRFVCMVRYSVSAIDGRAMRDRLDYLAFRLRLWAIVRKLRVAV